MKNKKENTFLIKKNFSWSYWKLSEKSKKEIEKYDVDFLLTVSNEENLWNNLRKILEKIKEKEFIDSLDEKEKKNYLIKKLFSRCIHKNTNWIPDRILKFSIEEIQKAKEELNWEESIYKVIDFLEEKKYNSLTIEEKKKKFIDDNFNNKDWSFYEYFENKSIEEIKNELEYFWKNFHYSYFRIDNDRIKELHSIWIDKIEKLRKELRVEWSINELLYENWFRNKLNSLKTEKEKIDFFFTEKFNKFKFNILQDEEKEFLYTFWLDWILSKIENNEIKTFRTFLNNQIKDKKRIFEEELWQLFYSSTDEIRKRAMNFEIKDIKNESLKSWMTLKFIVEKLEFEDRLKRIFKNNQSVQNYFNLHSEFWQSFAKLKESDRLRLSYFLTKKDVDKLIKESQDNQKNSILISYKNVFWNDLRDRFKIQENEIDKKIKEIYFLIWDELFDVDTNLDIESKEIIIENLEKLKYLIENDEEIYWVRLSKIIWNLEYYFDLEKKEDSIIFNQKRFEEMNKIFWKEKKVKRKESIEYLNSMSDKEFKKFKEFCKDEEMKDLTYSKIIYLYENETTNRTELEKIFEYFWKMQEKILQNEYHKEIFDFLKDKLNKWEYSLKFLEEKSEEYNTTSLKNILYDLKYSEEYELMSEEEKEFFDKKEFLYEEFWSRSVDQFQNLDDLIKRFSEKEIIWMKNYLEDNWIYFWISNVYYYLCKKRDYYEWIDDFINVINKYVEEFWQRFKALKEEDKSYYIRNFDFDELSKIRKEKWDIKISEIVKYSWLNDYQKRKLELRKNKILSASFCSIQEHQRDLLMNNFSDKEMEDYYMNIWWLSDLYLLSRNWFHKKLNNWKIILDCWHEIDITNDNVFLYRLRCWLNKRLCTHCFKKIWNQYSIWEKQVLEFILSEIYSWEILENERILIQENIKHNKEIDIYFKDIDFWIEYDWLYWHNEEDDLYKDNLAKEQWINLIRIKEEDWKDEKWNKKCKEFIKKEIEKQCKLKNKEHLLKKNSN